MILGLTLEAKHIKECYAVTIYSQEITKIVSKTWKGVSCMSMDGYFVHVCPFR